MTSSKALFIHGAGDIQISDFIPDSPTDTEVMVNVAAVGVCGSDLHYYKDGGIGGATIQSPFIPGHEFAAYVTQDIPEMDIQLGELVAVDPASPCHACEWCVRGYHNLCPKVSFIGAPPFNGAMTNALPVPKKSLIKLPQGINAEQGAMLEPLGVCIHAIDLAKPKLMESIAVIGCGGIGLGIIQLLVKTGCHHIIAIDPQDHRTAKALSIGANAAGASIDAVNDATNYRGCDLVIEASNSPDGMGDAIMAAAIGGRVVLVGIPDGDTYTPFPAAQARRRGLDVRFSRRMGDVYDRAIALVHHNHIDVDTLITHRFSVEDSESAFKLQVNNAPSLIKSMILPNQTGSH